MCRSKIARRIANAEDADLFISLHMNASVNSEASGIETYYLDNTTDEAAIASGRPRKRHVA